MPTSSIYPRKGKTVWCQCLFHGSSRLRPVAVVELIWVHHSGFFTNSETDTNLTTHLPQISICHAWCPCGPARQTFKATSGHLFTVLAQKRPYIYLRLKIWHQIWAPHARFPIRCKSLAITQCFFQIFNWKFAILWSDSYSTTKFGGTWGKIYACLQSKMAFSMQNC